MEFYKYFTLFSVLLLIYINLFALKFLFKKDNQEINHNPIVIQENKPNIKPTKKNIPDYKLAFTSQKKEISIDSLPIKGTFPNWLSGDLYRNGIGIFEKENKALDNLIDCLAMLHKFNFENGKISYKNKILQSDAYKNKKHTPTINNANINITKICGEHVALMESPLPVRFDPKTLETLGSLEYKDNLPFEKAVESAHPFFDKEKGEIINYLVNFGIFNSSYDIYKIKLGEKERKIITSIYIKEPSYMHSFGVTKNYIILTEYPFVVKPYNLIFSKLSFIENFEWKPQRKTTFYIIDRNSGSIKEKLTSDAFFSFHNVNAYEKNDKLYMDIITFEDIGIIDRTRKISLQLKPKNKNETLFGKLIRYEIDFKNHKISKEKLVDELIELPNINEKFKTKKYRYLYAVSTGHNNNYNTANKLVKIDLENKEIKIWHEDNCYPSEPIFVNAPDSASEDDGVILSIILDGKKQNSFLLILNAQDFKELARAEIPHHIPFSFHGQFYPSSKGQKIETQKHNI